MDTRAREETNFTIAVILCVDSKDGSLGGTVACDRGRLDARLIEALPALLGRVLETIATTPTAAWRALPLLPDAPRITALAEAAD